MCVYARQWSGDSGVGIVKWGIVEWGMWSGDSGVGIVKWGIVEWGMWSGG